MAYGIIGYTNRGQAAFHDDCPTKREAESRGASVLAQKSVLTDIELVKLDDVDAWRKEHGYGE